MEPDDISLTMKMAGVITDEFVARCDYILDLDGHFQHGARAQMGIRACEGHGLGDGAMERTGAYGFEIKWLGEEVGQERLEKAKRFVERYRGAHGGRLMPALYPGGVMSCSFEYQKAIKEKSDELRVPVSIHAGEWVVEFQNMLRARSTTIPQRPPLPDSPTPARLP